MNTPRGVRSLLVAQRLHRFDPCGFQYWQDACEESRDNEDSDGQGEGDGVAWRNTV